MRLGLVQYDSWQGVQFTHKEASGGGKEENLKSGHINRGQVGRTERSRIQGGATGFSGKRKGNSGDGKMRCPSPGPVAPLLVTSFLLHVAAKSTTKMLAGKIGHPKICIYFPNHYSSCVMHNLNKNVFLQRSLSEFNHGAYSPESVHKTDA